ncbi:MAG: hypothetical protein M1838_001817 [Thelocarpon superellum]|nr:MAG: hypothetical protein M1838_001817 [Thelocarpon superellum]
MAAAAAVSQPDALVPPDAPAAMDPSLTPPPSEKKVKPDDASSSDLSDLDDDPDLADVEPDHYYEGGRIPVFKPTMSQFRSFKAYIEKVDKYGMKSGIIKVIPPKGWRDALPSLDEAIKSIKVKNPITQEFEGTQGTYVQKNMEKQRSYNLPQWRELSEASNHQPPARRGERRRNQEKVVRSGPRTSTDGATTGRKRGRGKAGRNSKADESTEAASGVTKTKLARPLTPTSPGAKQAQAEEEDLKTPVKQDAKHTPVEETPEEPTSATKGRQPKSVSSRRKNNRREAADIIDEAAFADFDYRINNADEYTPERCEELERSYWKSITYNSPMYGADMPGSLFDDSTTTWNVAKLENLLDVLGQKIPGVNTAYLYLGMWKSTFAWHLEDVDLYSINYIHFGAPKQWYSISQEDARRFEAAMRDVWPIPAKACSQFLRHKTFLVSPSLLQSKYNIRVNRLVHHEGEFVITFPYGYHSGYNLGYNCAESVNFATESWLNYGRVAKKCNCEADSVWVDVNDIERKLRGEETEYEETDAEEDDEELDDDEDGTERTSNLPTPPESVEGVEGKTKPLRPPKRKRVRDGLDALAKVKRIRLKAKPPAREPCALCPNEIPTEPLLPTDDDTKAHRLCALYTPETFIDASDGTEKVSNMANIDKARLELKCNFCRSKRGACFQCSSKKCIRAYHATCAAAAGVLVDMRDVPVFGEDGMEYTDIGVDYRCRFHRPKRSKSLDGETMEESELIQNTARALNVGEIAQMQYYKGEIFAGVVVENRRTERTIVVDVLPRGHRVEVEYKWVLALDPADSHLPVPSANAKPLLAQTQQFRSTLVRPRRERPAEGDAFCDADGPHVWSEFHSLDLSRNAAQAKVDLGKANALWYYLGADSTDAKARYTEDPRRPRHNALSNFLDLVKPPPAPSPTTATPRRSYLAPRTIPAPISSRPATEAKPVPPLHAAPPPTNGKHPMGPPAVPHRDAVAWHTIQEQLPAVPAPRVASFLESGGAGPPGSQPHAHYYPSGHGARAPTANMSRQQERPAPAQPTAGPTSGNPHPRLFPVASASAINTSSESGQTVNDPRRASQPRSSPPQLAQQPTTITTATDQDANAAKVAGAGAGSSSVPYPKP